MPPVPPLMTANVAVDARGTAWVSRPWGLEPMDMTPLGGTNPGATPPSNPRAGDLWWDTGTNELKAWNGTSWIASAGGGSGGIAEPTTAGNWLRTNTGIWVAGLPLTGGRLTGYVNIAPVIDGGALRFENDFGGGDTWLQMLNDEFVIFGPKTKVSQTLLVGTPTGPALPATPSGNVNVADGYYVNGVSIGTPPFLPLTGGRVTGELGIGAVANGWRFDAVAPDLFVRDSGSGAPYVLRLNGANAGIECWNLMMGIPAGPAISLVLNSLPTTNPGIPGAVWNNGGVLNISP